MKKIIFVPQGNFMNEKNPFIDQIKEKVYPQSIREYTDNLLLVGITYDSKTKEHRCKIEKF